MGKAAEGVGGLVECVNSISFSRAMILTVHNRACSFKEIPSNAVVCVCSNSRRRSPRFEPQKNNSTMNMLLVRKEEVGCLIELNSGGTRSKEIGSVDENNDCPGGEWVEKWKVECRLIESESIQMDMCGGAIILAWSV